MIKPEILFHGSPNNIEGVLIPCKATDKTNDHPDNHLRAVYATDKKSRAVLRAIEKIPGIDKDSWKDVDETVKVFLYHLPSDSFERTSCDSSQYVSFVPVTPIRKEVVEVKYTLHLLNSS